MSAPQRVTGRGLPWTVAVAVGVLTLGLTAIQLTREDSNARARAEVRMRGTVQLLDARVAEVLGRVDVSTRIVAQQLQMQAGVPRQPPVTPLRMHQQMTIPEAEFEAILDSSGRPRADTQGQAQAFAGLADTDGFARARAGEGEVDLIVSGPVPSPVSGQPTLLLVRRLARPDGSFGGAVFAGLPANRLRTLLDGLTPGDQSVPSVHLIDGSRVQLLAAGAAGGPDAGPGAGVGAKPGQALVPEDAARFLRRNPGGVGAWTPPDAPEGLYALQRMTRYPLMLAAVRPMSSLAADWEDQRWLLVLMCALTLLLTFGVAALGHRMSARRRGAEQALADTQERLSLALDAANEGIWDWLVASKVSHYSPAYFRMLGYEPGDFAGTSTAHWVQLLHPEDRDVTLERAQQALRDPGHYEMEFRLRARDGTYRWILSRGRVVSRDAAGEPWRAVGTHTDITARKELELALCERRDELDAIFHAATVGILLIRRSGLQRCNARFEQLTGYSEAELRAMPAQALFPQEWTDAQIDEAWRTVEAGLPHTRLQTIGHRDGSRPWARITAQLLLPGRPELGVVAICEDISAERASAAQMQQARELAEDAARTKAEFLANMSHEIRTPMNAIVGMAHLALKTELSARQRGYIRNIELASQSLLGIINDVLDFSKIEAGKLLVDNIEFELQAVLDRVRDLVSVRAAEKGLLLRVSVGEGVPPVLVGDPLRLGQILTNFANNAVKFTERGSILLRVEARGGSGLPASSGVRLRFSVEDTGIGLSDEQRGRLFRQFEQADSSITRQYGGTGLGLTIAKRLAELMQGEVGVSSQLGTGSIFWFDGPFGRGDPPPTRLDDGDADADGRGAPVHEVPGAGGAVARQGSAGGARVLLVEDNELNSELAMELLTEAGFRVDTAIDGSVALRRVQDERYALVLMDMQMPVMDGLTATQEIRRLPGMAGLPIVAMTANALSSDRERCLAAGMNDYLSKPVDPQGLIEKALYWVQRGAAPAQQPTPAPTRAPGLAGVLRGVAGLDVDRGLMQSRGRETLYGSLLRKYIAGERDFCQRMRTLLSAADREGAERAAHNLKGASALVGAMDIRTMAETLEHAIRAHAPASETSALCDLIEAPLALLIDGVAVHL